MIEYTISAGSFVNQHEQIESRHFGGIYATFHGLNTFEDQIDALSLGHIRWPGGTRGEQARDINDADRDGNTGEYLFDLRADDLLLVPGKGFSDMLHLAASTGRSLSTFLPTQRYYANLDAAASDAAYFMGRLLDGDFGPLPHALTIEIGNESLDGTLETAMAYGAVANAQLTALLSIAESRGLDLALLNIDVAIQIGRSAEEDAAIRGQLSPMALSAIDALVVHHLPINLVNHNAILEASSPADEGDTRFTRTADYVDAWEAAIAPLRDGPGTPLDLYVSAWSVGGSHDPGTSLLQYHDYGARQARTAIDTFARLIAMGADGASLWGVDARANPNWFTRLEGDEIELSHGGEALRLMAESLPGAWLLEGYDQPIPASAMGTYEDFWIYAYETEDAFILFLAANDIDTSVAINLSVPGIDEAQAVELTRLGTQIDPDMPAWLNEDEVRLWERPDVTDTFIWAEDDTVQIELQQDFEVIRLIARKDPSDPDGSVNADTEGEAANTDTGNGEWSVATAFFECDMLL